MKLKGLDSSFTLNSLITSSHSGLGCHGNVYMASYHSEAKTGMAHIMLNPQFTCHNPSQSNTQQPAIWQNDRDYRPFIDEGMTPDTFIIKNKKSCLLSWLTQINLVLSVSLLIVCHIKFVSCVRALDLNAYAQRKITKRLSYLYNWYI